MNNAFYLLAISAFTMQRQSKRQLEEEFAEMKAEEFFKKFGKVEDRRVENRG